MHYLMIAFATLARLVPHPWNISPVGSFGLFAGANLPLRQAWLVPIVPLLVSDLIFGFYGFASMVGVYAGFLASIFIGRALVKGREKAGRIAGAVGLNVAVFFVISNLGVFASGYYGYSLEGLIACFVAALPFLGGTIVGDAFYACLLFGGKALLRDRLPGLSTAR